MLREFKSEAHGSVFQFDEPLEGSNPVRITFSGQTIILPMSDVINFVHELKRIMDENPIRINEKVDHYMDLIVAMKLQEKLEEMLTTRYTN